MLFDQPVKTRTRSQIRTHFWMKYRSNVVNPISHSQSWRFVVGLASLPVYTSKCTYSCTRAMLPLNESSVHRSADGWTSYCCWRSSRKRFCASSCRIWPIWRRSAWFKEPCRSHPRRFARGHSGAGSTRTSAKALQSHRTCKQPGTSLAPQYGQMSMGGSTARSLSKFKAGVTTPPHATASSCADTSRRLFRRPSSWSKEREKLLSLATLESMRLLESHLVRRNGRQDMRRSCKRASTTFMGTPKSHLRTPSWKPEVVAVQPSGRSWAARALTKVGDHCTWTPVLDRKWCHKNDARKVLWRE